MKILIKHPINKKMSNIYNLNPVFYSYLLSNGINLDCEEESKYKGVKKGKLRYFYAKFLDFFLFNHINTLKLII